MKSAIISIALLASLALALPLPNAQLYRFSPTMFGTPGQAGVNWRVLCVGEWWPQSSNAERAEALCVASAWLGTTAVFALLPWHNNPKVMRIMQIAGCAAVGGIFGTYIIGGLRERYER